MITDIEDYFARGCGRCERFATPACATRQWSDGLAALRRICLDAGLEETVKWGHPCYLHAGRNVAILGALRGDYRISFFDAARMQDPAGVLAKQGPNTRHANMIRFTNNAHAAQMKSTIASYLEEAMGYAEQGIRPAKERHELELPDELVAALRADPGLSAAFHRLTPGRQRSYVIDLNSAKKTATRVARIARFRARILAGKGATER